jgi:tetratricopeptide (TPR) repeat protein
VLEVTDNFCPLGVGCVRVSDEEERCERALASYRESGDRRREAYTLLQLAEYGAAERSSERYEAALSIARSLGDEEVLFETLYAAGGANLEAGRQPWKKPRGELTDPPFIVRDAASVARAVAQYEWLLALGPSADRSRFLSGALELSDLHQVQGSVDRALSVLERALPEAAAEPEDGWLEDGPRRYYLVRTLHRLAELHSLRGEWPAARAALRQALVVILEMKEAHDVLERRSDALSAINTWTEGLIHEQTGDLAAAARTMRDAIERVQQVSRRDDPSLLAFRAKLDQLERASSGGLR